MYSGRVVIGSWYGSKPVQLDLGGAFHRSRIRLISSQVSSLAPELSGRWDKSRRFERGLAGHPAHPARKVDHPSLSRTRTPRMPTCCSIISPSESIQVFLNIKQGF